MSIQYCHHCNKLIDTDYEAEHFEENEDGKTTCEEENELD